MVISSSGNVSQLCRFTILAPVSMSGNLYKDKVSKKFSQCTRSHNTLPSFRPIIDTTNTLHYSVGKFLTCLLSPLTQNESSVKDSFEAVNRICSIPPELFDESYCYISFDVTSLLTNVPLNRTIIIILKRVCEEKLVKTNLKTLVLKLLLCLMVKSINELMACQWGHLLDLF